ncbi:hypothetical protein G6F31_018149 [Rhizopus arrhizus]|nr:hypothetical protein G6F31_018149 [Rhizopus arrhizus]
MIGWCLALAGGLRLEQLRGDLHAQALLPLLHGGVVALLVLTLACTLAASARSGFHQHEPAGRTLEGVDLWHQALEVVAGAVEVERGAVRPELDEDEVPGILLVNEQFIADAQRLALRARDQLPVKRKHGFHGIGMDEILGDHLEHVGTCNAGPAG